MSDLSDASLPSASTPARVGLRFPERLRGTLAPASPPGAGPLHTASGALVLDLTLTFPDLERLLAGDDTARVDGTVEAAGLTLSGGAPVEGGTFRLLAETDSLYARQMRYALPFTGADGRAYLLEGVKEVRRPAPGAPSRGGVWQATTTVEVTLRADDAEGPALATGVLRHRVPELLRTLGAVEVLGAQGPAARARALGRFGGLFLGGLWDVFVRPRLEA
jgi:cholesterol oxidase